MSETEQAVNTLFDEIVGLEPERELRTDELTQTSYRPTLIIGLGGTGALVCRKLKRRLRKLYGSTRMSAFQFIAIDTTPADAALTSGSEALDPGEYLYLGGVDADRVVEAIDENAYIASWWDRNFTHPGYIDQGAHQTRAVGRLALFFHSSKVVERIQQAALNATTDPNLLGRVGKVYVISSVCGGTGSGMLIDIAYLARSLFSSYRPSVLVTGVLVFPDAFIPLLGQLALSRVRANAYAVMKEIDYFMTTRDFYARYGPHLETRNLSGKKPFDICYLINSVNSNAQYLGEIATLGDMVAEELFLEIASPTIGASNMNAFDNIDVESFEQSTGKALAYSSFAVGSLVYNHDHVVGYCAARATSQLITSALLARSPGTDEVGVQAQQRFFGPLKLREEGADELINRLNRDAAGNPLSVSMVPDELPTSPDELLNFQPTLEADRRAHLRELLKLLAANATEIGSQAVAALGPLVEEALGAPLEGLPFARAMLDSIAVRLQVYRDQEMRKEAEGLEAELTRQEAAAAVAVGDMAVAAQSQFVPILKRRRVAAAINDYVNAFNAMASLTIELEQRVMAISVYDTILNELRLVQQRLAHMEAKLVETARKMQGYVAAGELTRKQGEQRYALGRSVVDATAINYLYAKYGPAIGTPEERARLLNTFVAATHDARPGFSWLAGADTPRDEVGMALFEYLNQKYDAELGKLDILSLLRELDNGESGLIREHINRLFQQTAPFWNPEIRKPSEVANRQEVIGIAFPGANGGMLNSTDWLSDIRAAGGGSTAIPTTDPHSVSLLRTEHGLPAYVLTPLRGDCRSDYEDVVRELSHGADRRPVHVSTLWAAQAPDLHPARVEEVRTTFAVGYGLELIWQRGNVWWAKSTRKTDDGRIVDDYRLDTGIERSIDSFEHNHAARDDIKEQIERMLVASRKDAVTTLQAATTSFAERVRHGDDANRETYRSLEALTRAFVDSNTPPAPQ